jgi:RNA recognition motif-containing protein
MRVMLRLEPLPPDLTADDLTSLCAPFGQVVWAQTLADPHGQCLTFGYVEMASLAAANQARRALDGYGGYGRPLRVTRI